MKALLKAVRAALLADAAIVALNSGGIFTGRATDNASLPYLVVQGVGGFLPLYFTTTAIQIEHTTVRFRAWSTSAEGAVDTAERVEALFRATNVALDSGTVICTTKSSNGIEMDPDPADRGRDVYMGIIDLDFQVQRDPT